MEFSHEPVLVEEVIKALNINPNGIYIDGTAGGGGHSLKILEKLVKGKLIAIDQDPDAINTLEKKFNKNKNVFIKKANFYQAKNILENIGISSIDGILLDIGVSSYQLDNPERGFSYHLNSNLDMRMSKEGKSAYDIVNTFDVQDITKILFKYGEEKNAFQIAKALEKARNKKPIETTYELSEIIKEALPYYVRRKEKHPARKTFQALRIAVNNELYVLDKGLDNLFEILKPTGRLAVISFHSLEDRIIKQKMAQWCKGCTCPPDFPVCVCGKTPKAKLINKKPIVANEKEISNNKRSRSAKLRVCEKI